MWLLIVLFLLRPLPPERSTITECADAVFNKYPTGRATLEQMKALPECARLNLHVQER